LCWHWLATIFRDTRCAFDPWPNTFTAPGSHRPFPHFDQSRSSTMAKNLILWMLGVPISVLILLNVFGFL
jgi:hypothetical protein